jgi:site-specific recombinase XerD
MEAVGLDDVSHHTMRHAGVTLMLGHGINPRVIQFLAGRTSRRTLDRYGHVRDTEIRRAVTSNAAHVADAIKMAAASVATATKTAAARSEK